MGSSLAPRAEQLMQTIGDEVESVTPQISHSPGMARVLRRQAVKHFTHRLEDGGLGPIAIANHTQRGPPSFHIDGDDLGALESKHE